MTDINIGDEVFTLIEAAKFLKKSPRTVRSLIASKRLPAGKSGPNGGGVLEILRSDCIDYVRRKTHNQAVNAEDGHTQRENEVWLSSNVTEIGTAISSRQVEKELGAALARQTRNRRRNSTIS
ncbi:helix-turn-helix domain-containing protein [Martelella alba]|uniref:Helix-turn-helix domain-containing protein n=1 Tax=Martelella alba TaxID=2590451 RepID=A0ABY2SL56_9HYPH|nr:helix-turn-helix domain-containing protein [Martelella alba]